MKTKQILKYQLLVLVTCVAIFDSLTASADTVYVSNIYPPDQSTPKYIEKFDLATGADLGVFANTGLNPDPQGLAFDSAGNLFASNVTGNYIEKFSSTGTDLGVFASTGLDGPTSLAFDNAGNLYVACSFNNTIVKFTPGGVGSVFANTGLNYPWGLAFDSASNLFVSNLNGNTIEKFSSTGTDLGVFASNGLNAPLGLAFDSAGNLYVVNNGDNTILKFTPGGVGSVFANTGSYTAGLAFNSAGNLYVTHLLNNTVQKFSSTGIDLGAFASTGLDGPLAIAISSTPYSAQVQQPINADGSSVFTVRRGVVPVKFTLTQNGTPTCTLPPATIAVTRTSGGTTGAIDESVYVMAADTGSNFRIDGCQYIYNLRSSALGVGTYRVDIQINGQVVGSGIFQLK